MVKIVSIFELKFRVLEQTRNSKLETRNEIYARNPLNFDLLTA